MEKTFVDLGLSPLCNNNVKPESVDDVQEFFPLHVYVCENCLLVQLKEYVSPNVIFDEYTYFSSYSNSWLNHAKTYAEKIIPYLKLNEKSLVVELASNDGYMLKNFNAKNIPVLGVEPAQNVAEVAIQKGIRTHNDYFSQNCSNLLKEKYGQPDLIIGNNVLAHVPNLNDFVAGMKNLLKDDGIITMEFPHLLNLIEQNQFDTIYHEHFSYFSFYTVQKVFEAHFLEIFDVEELSTHGGSIRIYAKHSSNPEKKKTDRISKLLYKEEKAGMHNIENYLLYQEKVNSTKRKFLEKCIKIKESGKTIAGYGAPGKGNTLLNYIGMGTDFIDYTVDLNPVKQGTYLPGTLIPVYPPSKLKETKPDYILILPWNLKEEIMDQLEYTKSWNAKFIVPIPEVKIYEGSEVEL